VKISKPLADINITQKDKVTFECELSRPNVDVKWFKVWHEMVFSFLSSLEMNESL